MRDLRPYSIVINWDDFDIEQGDFGDTVRAHDPEHAERIVRAHMVWAHWRDHFRREGGESRRESLASYLNKDGSYFGSVVDCHEGAIWRANDLEKALRDLLRVVDEAANRIGWADHGERKAAHNLLRSIDAL